MHSLPLLPGNYCSINVLLNEKRVPVDRKKQREAKVTASPAPELAKIWNDGSGVGTGEDVLRLGQQWGHQPLFSFPSCAIIHYASSSAISHL